MGKSVARLYTQFQPETYDLRITIDEDAMRFSGTVTIRGRKTGRPSQRLTFHQNGLKITDATITKRDKKGETTVDVSRINHQNTLHEVRLHADTMLYPGEYDVTLHFQAPLTDAMTGIYPCYFTADGKRQKLIATQFESHHAREAFPCVDEPEAKAVFNLTLVTRAGVTVLSNNPISEQGTDKDTLTTRFESTPRMSTYLLAFVSGDMHSKSATTKSGVEVRTWATTAQPAAALDFGLDAAVRSIEFFEDYFDVPYPLPKADHVALPDFSSGAMENWGLITYRERILLAYPGETSASTHEHIALVVAHETSHQWFGNLVTMKWWDDLWLNESFANMMEYAAVDHMFPEWNIWDSFVAAEGLSALRRDAIAGVQSVHTGVHHPDEISTLFDPSIVYAKGGRLLNMMMQYIGEQSFRSGLTAYFKKHTYGNTTGADLWKCLSEASGKDVGAFMTPWLTRSGYPVVRVSRTGNELQLSQEQFLDNPAKADVERVWPVPLFAAPETPATLPDIFDKRNLRLAIPKDAVIMLDTEAHGHYILDYATDDLKSAVRRAASERKLSEPGRLMLLNSTAMLARAGYKAYTDALELLDAYREETSEPVWDIMALVSGESRRFVDEDPDLEPSIKRFTAELAAAQTARLGWDEHAGEPTADTKLRALVLGLSVYGENETVTAEALSRFAAYKQDDTALPAELRALIMLVPVQRGDRSAFDFLLTQHDLTQNSDLQSDICDALTATRNPEWASELLARLKDSTLVKPQDVDRWLFYLLRNRYTRDTAWSWMVDNWGWLEETFRSDKSYDYLPRYAAGAVNTSAYAAKYHALFDSKVDQPALKRNIELGIEEIEARLAWLARDKDGVGRFFRQRS